MRENGAILGQLGQNGAILGVILGKWGNFGGNFVKMGQFWEHFGGFFKKAHFSDFKTRLSRVVVALES